MTIEITDELQSRLALEAQNLGKTPHQRVIEILERAIAPAENFDTKRIEKGLRSIEKLLSKIPCIESTSTSEPENATWWLKFSINIHSDIAWNVVQELGHILNYLSLNERLPTRLYPVSPPPYMNGGPEDFLSWIIEPTIPFVDTKLIFDFLEGRLPEDYDKEDSWKLDRDEEND